MEVVKKEKQVKEVEIIVERYTLCDKCNRRIETSTYDAFECEFTHKTGKSYPEGGSGDIQSMQLCQKCAVECVELLQTNGYRIIDTEWDW